MHGLTLSLRTLKGIRNRRVLAQPLAGCSGASPSLPSAGIAPSSAHSDVPAAVTAKGSASRSAQPDGGGQQLFVSDAYNSKVYVFNAASKTSNPPVERRSSTASRIPTASR